MGHVTFIHGILNKTAPEELIQLWRRGLAEEDGFNLGVRGVTSSMVYWADVLYDKPLVESAHAESLEAAAEAGAVDPLPMEWRAQLRGKERDLVEGLARDLGYDEVEEEDPPPAGPQTGPSLERVPLPGFVKKRIMGHLLRDVHHYLYNVDFSPRGGRPLPRPGRDPQTLRRRDRGGQRSPGPARRREPQHGHGDRLRLPEARGELPARRRADDDRQPARPRRDPGRAAAGVEPARRISERSRGEALGERLRRPRPGGGLRRQPRQRLHERRPSVRGGHPRAQLGQVAPRHLQVPARARGFASGSSSCCPDERGGEHGLAEPQAPDGRARRGGARARPAVRGGAVRKGDRAGAARRPALPVRAGEAGARDPAGAADVPADGAARRRVPAERPAAPADQAPVRAGAARPGAHLLRAVGARPAGGRHRAQGPPRERGGARPARPRAQADVRGRPRRGEPARRRDPEAGGPLLLRRLPEGAFRIPLARRQRPRSPAAGRARRRAAARPAESGGHRGAGPRVREEDPGADHGPAMPTGAGTARRPSKRRSESIVGTRCCCGWSAT